MEMEKSLEKKKFSAVVKDFFTSKYYFLPNEYF